MRFERFFLFFCLPATMSVMFFPAFAERRSGYITDIRPHNQITLDMKPVRITERTKINVVFPDIDGELPSSFAQLLPGMQATAQGSEDAASHEFIATKLDYVQLSPFKPFTGWSIADRAPELASFGTHWTGKVYADGYELQVSDKTTVQLPNGEKEINALPPDIWVKYKALRLPTGSYSAISVSFIPNQPTDKEKKFLAKGSELHLTPPDYASGKQGKVSFGHYKIAILADQEAADYVTCVVNRLVPQWQKLLPKDAPNKVHFHVYILQSDGLLKHSLSDGTGNILISTRVLAKLQNEAQLATLFSSDVSGTLLRVQYRYMSKLQTEEALQWGTFGAGWFVPFLGLGPLIIGEAYKVNEWTPLLEQEYRVGMRYLSDAGYDVRQAPEALRRVDDKNADKKEAKGEIVFGTAAHLEQIYASEYSNQDWSGKRVGQQEYESFLNRIKAEDPKLKK